MQIFRNETEAPHAHILNNGKRVAKINANGEIISGAKNKQIVRFVSKFKKMDLSRKVQKPIRNDIATKSKIIDGVSTILFTKNGYVSE